MKGYFLDPETSIVKEHFAVIYAPKRNRDRFPENCVDIVASEAEALRLADIDNKRYPAIVIGPARSSEGLRLFYLVDWLDDQEQE